MASIIQPQEILEIERLIRSGLNQFSYSRNLYETKTLSRCIYSSIASLIRGACKCSEEKERNACSILIRSIVEHTIDLEYIAYRNDQSINSLFINYYKLKRFWERYNVESQKEHIPQIEQEYREYIFNNLKEVIAAGNNKRDSKLISGPNKIDKKIRDIYSKSWTGLGFHERSGQLMKIKGFKTDSFWEKSIIKYFKFMSDFAHPTPYSAIPHFEFKSFTFSLDFDKNTIDMQMINEMLITFLIYATHALSHAFNDNEKRDLKILIDSLFSKFTVLSDLFEPSKPKI